MGQEGGLRKKDAHPTGHAGEMGQAGGCEWVGQSKFLWETVAPATLPFLRQEGHSFAFTSQ